MSDHQELLVSFFQSKETQWNWHFFFLEDMIKGLLITCHSGQWSLIIFLTVPTQTTCKISFFVDVNDGKATNIKISSPVAVEQLFRLGSLASFSRNIGYTYRLNSGIPDQVQEKIRGEVDHTHCLNKWNFFFRDSFTALSNSWVTAHVTSWEGQVHVAAMLASFLFAGSETSVTNYARFQLDVTKRNYFGVFSDLWVETNKIQLPSKIRTSSVYGASNIHVQRRWPERR